MTLLELFQAVKEKTLTKNELESSHSELSHLFADMSVEMAEIEKQEALFFYEKTKPDVSDISIKREWRATEKGQRQILLKRYLGATSKILSSIKSRMFEFY